MRNKRLFGWKQGLLTLVSAPIIALGIHASVSKPTLYSPAQAPPVEYLDVIDYNPDYYHPDFPSPSDLATLASPEHSETRKIKYFPSEREVKDSELVLLHITANGRWCGSCEYLHQTGFQEYAEKLLAEEYEGKVGFLVVTITPEDPLVQISVPKMITCGQKNGVMVPIARENDILKAKKSLGSFMDYSSRRLPQ